MLANAKEVRSFQACASRAGTISSCRLRGDRTRQTRSIRRLYFSEILIPLEVRSKFHSRLVIPCRAILTPFSFPRLNASDAANEGATATDARCRCRQSRSPALCLKPILPAG